MKPLRIMQLVAFAAICASLGGVAEAQDRRVKLTNSTGDDIVEVNAWRVGSRSNANILAGRRIPSRGSVTVNFANATGACEYDIRVVFTGGGEVMNRNVNVCEVGELNLSN
jgi:hypothetical protein